MASAGLTNTGFSESSQVSMYNTYQNRVATARESFNRAVMDYNMAIKDAQLQNSVALAEIAANALQKRLELSLEGFQYKNQLVIDMTNKKIEISNTKWNRYQDILQQINTENAMKEEVRQFESTQKFQEEQNRLNREFQADQSRIDREFKAAQAELDRKHAMDLQAAKTKAEKEKLERQHELDMEQLAQKHTNDKALLQEEYALKQQSVSYTGGGSGGSSSSKYRTGGAKANGTKTGAASYSSGSSKTTTTTSKSNPTVNMQSVTNLGYGPISANELAKKVKSGEVTYTVKNGQIYYSRVVKMPSSRLR
jgi:hypothetical protein